MRYLGLAVQAELPWCRSITHL